MKTITVNLYSFNELSEEAKQSAIESYRQTTLENDFSWADEYIGTLKKAIPAFDYTLQDWSIDSLNANASTVKIKCDLSNEVEELEGNRLRTYLLNNYYNVLFERKHYGEYKGGKYPYYSKIQKEITCCPFTGFCGDEDFLQPMRAFINKPDSRTFTDLINDCIDNLLRALESDCESQLTDEYITETIEANDYTFEIDGTMNNG